MERGIFKFVLRYSKKQQLMLLLLIGFSYPFYYFSLDLPKTIVNEAISGTDFPRTLFDIELDQIEYLLVLCFAFLALVLINGGMKFAINVYRGVVGERMLRRLRYFLVQRILHFPLSHFNNISEGEIVSMVTAETEPLGGFVGESLSLPAFQGGMLITALIFMFVQDPILGIAAIALYPVQAWGIPKLQRKVNLLNKERVLNVRKLSERINELVAGASEIHAHDTAQYELADFSDRLGTIFGIRYQVYQKKFLIKFINNFLAQITPFFFFSIGGYSVIKGDLSIGALVAILAAYKDLSPPWKELLNFYQRMEDARIKYSQLAERFDPPGQYNTALLAPSADGAETLQGKVIASNLTLEEDEGTRSVEGASFTFGLDEHITITGGPGGGKEALARLIARQSFPTAGTLSIDGNNLSDLPEHVTGRQFGYVDQDAYIRSGNIHDNILYGLKHYPQHLDHISEGDFEPKRQEAIISGNSEFDINADWLGNALDKTGDDTELEKRVLSALVAVGLEDDILNIGLRMTIDPDDHPVLSAGILKARDQIHEHMANNDSSHEFEGLVESWDHDTYNRNASVAENILFGTPVDDTFAIDTLGNNEYVLAALDKTGLREEFASMGRNVAALMVELFSDIPPGHEFFERFSFISADDLPEFQTILNATAGDDSLAALSDEQCERLLQLPFKLVKARHRLGLIDEAMEARLLDVRHAFAENLPEHLHGAVSFFDHDVYNPASSILDNTIFGKVDSSRADSSEKILQLVTNVFDELSLRTPVLEAGLLFDVGIAGRRLSAAQRQKVAIARNLVKQPQLLVVNEAASALDGAAQHKVFKAIKSSMDGRGLVWVDGETVDPSQFDRVFQADAGRIKEITGAPPSEPEVRAEIAAEDTRSEVGTDTELLARIPFFAGLDRSRLKLLAFTSERQVVNAHEVLFRQGDTAKMACVIVDGTFSIIAETGEGRVKVADAVRGGVIGELALLCEAPRTATVQANERSIVLKISKDVFIKLINDNPAVGANLSRILANKLESMMRNMSAHYELYDPVTGLPNRNLFIDYMKTTANLDARNKETSSLLLISFDGLEDLDLTQDLDTRQELLRELKDRIKLTVRSADAFGRLEGYRFGIIARGLDVAETTKQLAERIEEELSGEITVAGTRIDLKISRNINISSLTTDTLRPLLETV